ELSLVAFGAPTALVVELDHVAADGAMDQHNHGFKPDGARALRERIATPPFAWRASAGGFEIVSRSGDGAAVRFDTDVEVLLDAGALNALRAALSEALSGSGGAAEPGRNEPCPCGSGRKYKRCCGS
ncbi:MAG: motif, partial [Solirubrobacteraceae bacterium]|nr:motif [Solirubrobacteraceae bacterium]